MNCFILVMVNGTSPRLYNTCPFNSRPVEMTSQDVQGEYNIRSPLPGLGRDLGRDVHFQAQRRLLACLRVRLWQP
jgi:hypothetical protein